MHYAKFRALLPGIILALLIAVAARFLSTHYRAPVMLFALLLGMAFHFMALEERTAAGVDFASRSLLRLGVGLLGAGITFEQISALGMGTIVLVLICVAATVGFGLLTAHLFCRHWSFGLLSGGAVAICGASAALAISAVLPDRPEREKDTLFTVAAVTGLSTVAMILYPILFAAFGYGDREIGVLIGATIHDVAQVVGAGYAVSDLAGDTATFVKLLRVALLPIVVLTIAFLVGRNKAEPGARIALPGFVVLFGALVVMNSLGLLHSDLASFLSELSRWLLITSIAALGMKTTLKDLFSLGPGHIGTVAANTLFLMGLAALLMALLSGTYFIS